MGMNPIAPINIACPHCGERETKVSREGVDVCLSCKRTFGVFLARRLQGIEVLSVQWFEGMDACKKEIFHHVITPPRPELREYKCLACGWHESSTTDWFKCRQCGNWTHDDIRARFEALKDLPPPRPQEPYVKAVVEPVESPSLYVQSVGRASRYPEGDMTLPGYDLKAARKGREDRRALALVLGCIAVLLSTASIVTAHDFSEVIWRLTSVAAGVTWAHCLLALDKR